jgi:hypothetical protein
MVSFGVGITQFWTLAWLSGVRVARVKKRIQRRTNAAAAFIALVVAVAPTWVEAAGRVALVMVGEDYQKLQKSNVSAKQASDIAEALQAKGFEVLLGANPTNARARALLLDFSRKANDADLAIAVVMGHVAAASGQSYFLPVNTELGVSTDLFSRGISISSVAQIVGKAKAGAVVVLMTSPNFENAVPGLDMRPQYTTANPTSVVTVFSSSPKVSVSRIDVVSAQAADAAAKLLQQPAPSLADLVKSASADVGAVFGAPAEVSLAKPVVAPASAAASGAQPAQAKLGADAGAYAQDKQKGRAEFERRSRDDESQAEAARLQLQQAKTELEKAKAETQRAQAEASRAEAEAEKAKAEAQAELARAQMATANASGQAPTVSSTPIDEKLLGKRQRERIQERLKDMSLYTGPIDSIMGPLTREAIMGYQRSKGAKVTGYLTPEQFQALLPDGD